MIAVALHTMFQPGRRQVTARSFKALLLLLLFIASLLLIAAHHHADVDDHDDCQICMVVQHQGAITVAAFLLVIPFCTITAHKAGIPLRWFPTIPPARYRSRAPPH